MAEEELDINAEPADEQPIVVDEQAESTDAPAEQKEEIPAVITEHYPAFATVWGELGADKQAKLLSDITRQLAEEEPGEQIAEPQETEQPAAEETPVRPAADYPALNQDIEARVIEHLGDTPEIREFVGWVKKAVAFSTDVGRTSLEVAQSAKTITTSLQDEKSFEKALNNKGDTLKELDDAAYAIVQSEAQKIKKAGRAATWDDAIDLALVAHQRQAGRPALGNPNKAALAASVATRGNGQRRPARGLARTFAEAAEMARQQVR